MECHVFLWILLISPSTETAVSSIQGEPWKRHVIDNSSVGADGVRLADVDGDGLLDITTGWEEGGVIRVYRNPGHEAVKEPWTNVTAGSVRSPEDAVFCDLDGDGAVDVASSCEGREQSLFFHFAPKQEYWKSDGWQTVRLSVSAGRQWMFALPMQVDGKNGPDLICGSKGSKAGVGIFVSPTDPRQHEAWRWHPLYDGGWIMALIAEDMDGDGDADVLITDRKGANRGLLWLENPGIDRAATQAWNQHRIGAADREVMFADVADLDADGGRDILIATRDNGIMWLHRQSSTGAWQTDHIPMPSGCGTGKSVRVGDLDNDGKLDLVVSCENARDHRRGVFWLKSGPELRHWQPSDISGPQGIKFDLVELIDLDGDGDLDVLTCEEQHKLGVIWYENPTNPSQK